MNPEALEYSYGLFTNDGYNGTLEEYQELISTNQEALDYSFNLFTADGYNGSIEDFTNLTSGSEVAEEEVAEEEVVEEEEEEVVEEEEEVEEEMVDKAVGFDPTQEDRYSMDSQDFQYRDPYSRFVAKEMARIHNSGTPVKPVEEDVVEEPTDEEIAAEKVTDEEWLEEHGTSVYNFLMPDGSTQSVEKWELAKFMQDNKEAKFQDTKKVIMSPSLKKQIGKNLLKHEEEKEPTPNEIYGVSPFGLTNEEIEGEKGSGVYIPGETKIATISENPLSNVIQTYKSGVELIKGPLPLSARGTTYHGQDPNYKPKDEPWYDGALEVLDWGWDHIAHAFADNTMGMMLSGGMTEKRYHYKLPNGQLVPYEYFNSPEAQNAYLKKHAQADKIKGLVELGSEEKQVAYVEDKVSSFLTKSELIYKDKEAEFLELEKNAKTDEEKLAVSQLKTELDKERDKLGLGERLYDTEGKLLNSISAAREEEIETKAEDLASTTGLSQLKAGLVDDYYEYMSLLKEVGNHTIDIGKSRSAPEKAIGWIKHTMEGTFSGKEKDMLTEFGLAGKTFYDDVKNIQKMIESGDLGSFVDLPGNHPLAAKFEDIQDRMLVRNRAIQLNSDATTQPEINEFVRQIGNLMENVSGENPIQQAYGMGLSVGKTDQEERYHIMKDIKNELGYVLPPELIENHEHTWNEYAGDVVTSLIPLITSTVVLKKAGYAKPKVFNQLGDALKGSGKSRAWNGVVNTLIGSSKYKHSALNEIAYFAGVDKFMEVAIGSEPASNVFIGSLGAGNSIYSQVSSKVLGKYGKVISPLLNAMNKSHYVKGVGKTVGPAISSTIVFEGAKGVEHFATHGIDGIEEIYSVEEVVGDFIGFAAMNVPGSLKPGIENLSRDILGLRGYTIESFKASKTLGLKPGKDGYFPTSKEINDKVLEKTNELIDEAGGEGAEIDAPRLEQLQKEIYELEQAGEALNQHNDIVKAKKTASYVMGLDASAYVVGQKLRNGEELNAQDQAVLNHLGPEYIAYKLNGNKPADAGTQGLVDRLYKVNQDIYKGLKNMGINPMSKEGIDLVSSQIEASKVASEIEKLKKQISKQPGNKALLEKQLEKVEKEFEQLQAEQTRIYDKAQEKSDKSYEEDVKDTEGLIEEINEKGGFHGEEISFKEIDDIYDAKGQLVKSSDAQWAELGLDKGAEGQFRDNTLYIHKTRAQDRKANSVASHELLHALLKNSFKNRKGDITKEGMEIINSFREMLPPDQQKIINDRIAEQYAVDKNGKSTVPKEKYYEEYLTAFIDGIKQGKIQYSDKTWSKLAEQVGPNFRNLFGKGKVGVTSGKELYNFLRDFNKVSTSPKARARIVEFATKDNVVGEKGKEVEVKEEVEVEVKPADKKKVEVKEEVKEDIVEDIVEENYSKEPIPLRTRPRNGDPVNMTKEAAKNEDALLEKMILRGIDNKYTSDRIFETISKRIGWNINEQRAVKEYIKSRVKGSVTTPFGKWRQGKPKTTPKKSVTSRSKELGKSEIELKEEKKKLIETQKKLGSAKSNTPEYKSNIKRIKEINTALKTPVKVKPVSSFKGLNNLDWKKYKNQEEWENSKEFEAAAEFIYKNPGVRAKIEKGLFGELATETNVGEVITKMIDHIRRFDPSKYKAPGSASLLGYFNNQFSNRIGDVGKKAEKQKASSIDKALPRGEGKTTYAETLKSKDREVGDEIKSAEPAPKSTMRKTESVKLSPKEVKVVEKDIDKWIDSNIEGLLKKDSKTLTTKLKAQSKKAIKDIILKKLPLARNKVAYEAALKDLYKEFEKLADISVSKGGKRVKGDPSIFISKGGKGFKDFIYSEKGFTEGGNPKRVQVRKGKEDVAWQFRKFGDKPGEISEKAFIDFFTRKGEYKDWPSRPNELRTKIADIISETVFKDAMPEALKRNKEKLGPEAQREILFEEISNDLMRDSDLILSKSPDLVKSIENIKEAEKVNIEKRRILDELAYLGRNNSKAQAALLQKLQNGETIGDWLKENPKFNSYFAGSIMNQLKAIAKAAKEQGGASVKKGIDAMPDKVVIDGKTIDISGLKDYMKSPESAMYGQTKKGGQKANWFDEVILERYINHAVKFSEKLPTWIQEMANKEAVLQTVGLGTSPTAKSALSLQESIKRINKQQDKLKAKNKDLRTKKPKGWQNEIEVNNKKIEALRQKDPTPKIGLQTNREMHNIPWVRNQGDRVMEALGKNESKAFEGLKERLKDFYTDSQMKTQMGKEFKDLTDAEIAEFVSKKINEGNNALRRDVYDAIQKAKEEYISEAKTEAETLERMEYVLRKAKENTNLTSGLDRQAVPIEAIYWPKGKKLNLETLKLEHLKTSVDQSMQSASAIIQGKWDTLGKKSMKDYVGVLSPKRLLDIIDREGGTTNTSTLARMALDIEELKNYRTVESGFKETYYDAIVNRVAKDLKLSSVEIKALKEPYLTDALNLYRGNTNEIGKIIVDNALKNKNELRKVAVNNRDIQPIASKSKKLEPISMSVERLAKIDKVLNEARKFNKKPKKARVFDFDDTVARTKSNVLYEMPNGKKGKLTAEEFAKKGEMMEAEGVKWDFSEFNKVVDGKKGPLFEVMKKMKEAAGERDLFILTARAPEAAKAIHKFLKEMGIDIPLENIKGLGDSSPIAKADYILDLAVKGYNDFYFADDHTGNVKAVKEVLDVIDVKGKVQQAIASKSKDLDKDFNKILEKKSGIEWYKEYSKAKAKVAGAGKGKYKIFVPPGAEDFTGLIYPTLGKGKVGEAQLEWYNDNLIKPYNRATRSLASERVNMMADFKALKKQLNVPKELKKQNKTGFTNEQAARVYIWESQGVEIPGLSKRDLKELIDVVENNPTLQAFADQLQTVTKGDLYTSPSKDWLSGTITTDLIELVNTTKRNSYLEGWQQNIDVIYSEKNLNKLEAIYGSKYREALENSIQRMKTGRNRTSTGNKASDALLDYINGAQGTIMFLNMRSAVLQSISAANFVNLGFNNPIKAGKAFLNQKQYWKDFMEIMNSDYLINRRSGLKLNISESEIADAAKSSKNKAKAVINYILEKGYTPTKFMDSFAIASGGATWYRNRIKDLIKKEGLSEAEAKKKAFEEFMEISEKSQQSSDPSKISAQQSSDMGRVFLQFVNTPMQYVRLQKRAAQDLGNKRGDWKSNVGKILYYGVMQNLWFNAMQQGLFALGFGDDEINEKEEKRIIDTANGMADSILRGSGFAGMTVSVLKNTIIDLYRRSGKQRPEYGDAWMKLLEFSPAVKSKFGKLKSAAWPFDTKKGRKEIKEKGFSLDNPAYESLAKVISAATNIPLDRVYSKYNNLSAIMSEETGLWKDIALFLGWPEWQLEEGGTVKEDKIRNLMNDTKKEEQVQMLLDLGYTHREIKRLKKEENRAEAIISSQN